MALDIIKRLNITFSVIRRLELKYNEEIAKILPPSITNLVKRISKEYHPYLNFVINRLELDDDPYSLFIYAKKGDEIIFRYDCRIEKDDILYLIKQAELLNINYPTRRMFKDLI